jgi:site-specific DNA recombinase
MSTSSLYDLEMEFLGMKSHVIYAGYPRVSDPGLKDSKTLESQEAEIKRYIVAQGGEVSEDLLFPEAMTAYNLPFRERKEFMKIIDAAKRGIFQVLVVTEYSRLSRRQIEQAVIIDLLEKYGVKVESVTEKFDDSAIGQFMRSAFAFQAEIEREKTLYRTQRGKRDRATQALTGMGKPKYGYTYVDNEDYDKASYILNLTVIHVDKEGTNWTEPGVIRFIHDRLQHGWSLRKTAIHLTELGVPTPRRKNFWSVTTVAYIAKERWYTGKDLSTYYYETTRDDQTKKKRVIQRPHDEQIKLPDGLVPQIITVECYDATQEQLVRNQQYSMRNNKHPQDTGIMRGGLARCGVCGYSLNVRHEWRMVRGEKEDTPAKYSCSRKHGRDERVEYNHYVAVFAHKIDAFAWEIAVTHIKDPALIRQRVADVLKEVKPHDSAEEVKKSLDALNRKIKNLISLAEEASDDDELLNIKGRVAEYSRQKREIATMLNEVTEEEDSYKAIEQELQRFEEWAAKIRPYVEDADFKPSYQEMQTACVILGITVRVFPDKPEYKDRAVFEVAPPSIMKVIGKDYVQDFHRSLYPPCTSIRTWLAQYKTPLASSRL